MFGLPSVADRVSLTVVSMFMVVAVLLLSLHQFSPSSRIHNHCRALQRDGWWADKQSLLWQPNGCTLRKYSALDVQKCLAPSPAHTSTLISEHVLFIGDSSLRNKFYALANIINPDHMRTVSDTKAHSDLTVGWPAIGGAVARFIWDPYLSSNQTREVLEGRAPVAPRVLIVGTGAWYLHNGDESGGVHEWRKTVDRLVLDIAALRDNGSVEHIYVSPISTVVPSALSTERRRTLNPDTIGNMNAYMDALDLPMLMAWLRMTEGMAAETQDGLHYSKALNNRAVGVLLNRVCNREVLTKHMRPPFLTTCCFEYPAPNGFVVLMAALTVAGLPLLIVLGRQLPAGAVPSARTLWQMLLFCSVLLFMYVCDRTPLFAKLHKSFDARVFALLIGLALAGGVATWDEDKSGGFLGRQQTDEWKGWMQIVILVYHLLNASAVAAIYNPVRVLVAMYLFMTGYGHCVFFIKKADFGLKRLTSVLLRTNLLAVALAYMMNTSYMDYYFAPLSSAWVLIVWLTMRVAPALNQTNGVWVKLLVSAALVSAVNRWHLWPFALLARLGVRWVQREWEFRFGIDIFIVYIGMATALVVVRHSTQLQQHVRWAQMQRWAVLLSAACVAWYFWFEATRKDKFVYNAWHPYVSPLVVLAFVVLRNSTETLRCHTSSLYRATGLISLELFIAQFHLFLAADTKAVLVLTHPRLWFVNLAVVSVVFVGMCRLLGDASGAIVAWMMAVPLGAATAAAAASGEPTAGGADNIAMLELGSNLVTDTGDTDGDSRQAQVLSRLDRLAAKPRLIMRVGQWLRHVAVHSLGLRWALGLLALLVLNNIYD
ncbi:hypothetical protein GGF37_001140 [Kickxella alabastrina]|nr:hypothetical protein GGF37_001140 [Kickxella alabastrina]